MNDDPTNLARLHDIVEPPSVSWWPLAPGWYVLAALVAVVLIGWLYRYWTAWRAKAYRRVALRELAEARTPTAISEVLRRTALAIAPRSLIASLAGEQWPLWLAGSLNESMPEAVKDQLASGMYRQVTANQDVDQLHAYARTWIEKHQLTDESLS